MHYGHIYSPKSNFSKSSKTIKSAIIFEFAITVFTPINIHVLLNAPLQKTPTLF